MGWPMHNDSSWIVNIMRLRPVIRVSLHIVKLRWILVVVMLVMML